MSNLQRRDIPKCFLVFNALSDVEKACDPYGLGLVAVARVKSPNGLYNYAGRLLL